MSYIFMSLTEDDANTLSSAINIHIEHLTDEHRQSYSKDPTGPFLGILDQLMRIKLDVDHKINELKKNRSQG